MYFVFILQHRQKESPSQGGGLLFKSGQSKNAGALLLRLLLLRYRPYWFDWFRSSTTLMVPLIMFIQQLNGMSELPGVNSMMFSPGCGLPPFFSPEI
jgi:hypothetical protein